MCWPGQRGDLRLSLGPALVAVDASWAQLGSTGVGRTLSELLPRLAARMPLVALVDARRPLPDLDVAMAAIGAPSGAPRLGWLELGVAPWLARRPGTLLHGAAYALPLRHRGASVVTFYDVAWEAHPRDFGRAKRRVWQASAGRSASAAGAVLTTSAFSKREIVAAYGLDPATVLVAPCAAGADFRSGGARVPGLPGRYVVALGGARRRNLPLAVEAWRQVRSAGGDVGLVVVGPEPPPDEPGVTWLGVVGDGAWAAVLGGAEALVYPTSYEGFGMPAAEACASGVPVVCTRVASLPEVLGDAAAWAPRLDSESFASTLGDLLADPASRARLAAAALARAAQAPTWDDAAEVTLAAYELAWRRHKMIPAPRSSSGQGTSGVMNAEVASAQGQRLTTPPKLSVVIVNWNAGPALLGCLRSLVEHPPTAPYEVIVVDNASTDGSVEAARLADPSIRLILNQRNRGLAAANNQGIVAARADMILVSNPDVVYEAGAVDSLRATLRRHPRAAIAVPRLRYEDGTLHTSVGDLPTLRQALAGRQAHRRSGAGPSGFWWDGWAHDEERQVGRGHEAAYLVARPAIEDVGLQDERYFLDWEGIDWTARLADAGWEVWFTPEAGVTHLGGVSIRQVPFRWIVRSHRGIYRYFAIRHPWWRPWLAPVLVARAGLKLAAAAVSDVYERGHRHG